MAGVSSNQRCASQSRNSNWTTIGPPVGRRIVSMVKSILVCLLAATAFAQKGSPDLCVPPLSGTAPALPAHLMTGQGTEYIHMTITTSSPQAQAFFDQGLAQLHSFWSTEAERSFLQAAALDPDAPMPWWGVAMISGEYRPRHQMDQLFEAFGRDPKSQPSRPKDAAERAIALSKVPGKASDLEKLYIAAVAARRIPSSKDPNDAYIDALRALLAKYPKEVEARLFLSLHLMRGYELPDHTPRPGTMEAVNILRTLLVEAPNHPGVHHYVIHAWEGSSFASEAWPSCKRYAELVTNIPHALHMPGHIYSQTGKFAEAEKSFGDAAVNELGYIKADALYGTGHHGHNVHYLSTAYAFDGQYDKAYEHARSLLEFKENPRELAQVDSPSTAHRQGWFALMRAMVLAEDWDKILDGNSLPEYKRPREEAWRYWAIGMAHAAKGEDGPGYIAAGSMQRSMVDYEDQVKRKPPAELVIARQELEGHLLAVQSRKHNNAPGLYKDAMKEFAAASAAQRKLRYSEPPYYPRPVAEGMGEVALRAGKLSEAEVAFRLALQDLPNSSRSVKGLAETLKQENKSTGAAGN
jgi:tetratricopeptide (TPR) repeat protein